MQTLSNNFDLDNLTLPEIGMKGKRAPLPRIIFRGAVEKGIIENCEN